MPKTSSNIRNRPTATKICFFAGIGFLCSSALLVILGILLQPSQKYRYLFTSLLLVLIAFGLALLLISLIIFCSKTVKNDTALGKKGIRFSSPQGLSVLSSIFLLFAIFLFLIMLFVPIPAPNSLAAYIQRHVLGAMMTSATLGFGFLLIAGIVALLKPKEKTHSGKTGINSPNA